MSTFVTVIHIITCVLLILVVLIQSGKGAEISASLGGSSQTVFGSSGGANFFTRFTSVLAAIFMATSLGLTVMHNQARKSLFEGAAVPAGATPAAPAADGGTGNVTTAPAPGGAPAAMPGAPANNAPATAPSANR